MAIPTQTETFMDRTKLKKCKIMTLNAFSTYQRVQSNSIIFLACSEISAFVRTPASRSSLRFASSIFLRFVVT
jgi:hypothetical protein